MTKHEKTASQATASNTRRLMESCVVLEGEQRKT